MKETDKQLNFGPWLTNFPDLLLSMVLSGLFDKTYKEFSDSEQIT